MDEVSQQPARHSHKKLFVALAIMVALILIATSILLLALRRNTENPVVSEFKAAHSATDFPLFVPNGLPNSYSYKLGSLHVNNDVAVFSISGPGNRILAVTEQAKSTGYDFSKLSGTVEFNSSLGKSYVEDFEIRTTGSIVGDKTWLIINTDNPIGADDMKAVLLSFKLLS